MKKVIYSDKTRTYNIIHDSGVQTSVKFSQSGYFDSGNLDRDNPILQDKNKVSFVISCNKGCPMSCTFCHLTKLNKPTSKLSAKEIYNNIMEAVEYVEQYEDLSSKYIKLCYMGEGEPLLNFDAVYVSSIHILSSMITANTFNGVDGVDISTCMPKVNYPSFSDKLDGLYYTLYTMFNEYKNPANINKSLVRLFYSLHHYDADERAIMIPNTRHPIESLSYLSFSNINLDFVVHYMFISGVNDSTEDVDNLIEFVNKHVPNSFELRILRYNSFDGKDIESPRLQKIIHKLEAEVNCKLKVQYSAGEDIKAACGMFL